LRSLTLLLTKGKGSQQEVPEKRKEYHPERIESKISQQEREISAQQKRIVSLTTQLKRIEEEEMSACESKRREEAKRQSFAEKIAGVKPNNLKFVSFLKNSENQDATKLFATHQLKLKNSRLTTAP